MDARHRLAASLARVGGPVLKALPDDLGSWVAKAVESALGLRGEADLRREECVRALLDSRIFDTGFYAEQAGLRADPEACVRHYALRGAAAGYLPNRLFDTRAYLANHPDVAESGFEPFLHFVMHGLSESRRTFVPATTVAQIAAIREADLTDSRVRQRAIRKGWSPSTGSLWADRRVAVYASSLGNFFLADLADRIAAALQADGICVCRLDQNSARPSDVAVDLFVAPHEFFHLGAGVTWRARNAVRRSIMLNTEQPGTHWHFLAMHYAGPETMLLDLSPQAAVLLNRMGRDRSAYLPIGWCPSAMEPHSGADDDEQDHGLESLSREERGLLATSETPWDDRPIDVLFLGTATTRRQKALARLAPTLAKYRCFIHMPSMKQTALTARRNRFGIRQSLSVARRAKVLLNVHRDDVSYFEWHRIVMMGIQQGALVVSEPCWPSPGVEPNRHFLASEVEDIPHLLERLLERPPDVELRQAIFTATSELPDRFDLRSELRALAFLQASEVDHRA